MKDLCQPSIEILKIRCTQWFKKKGIPGRLHFPDCDDSLFGEDASEVAHVVFFGSFLKRFLESANWTPRAYRFWVLCEGTQEVMSKLLGVPAHQIGTIPRYELFPVARKQREFPALGDRFTLVFAGRISPSKNVETLLRAVSFLQTEQGVPVELVLFGRFDSEPRELRNYRTRILKCIRETRWTVRPRLVQGRGPEEWYREKLKKPVLVSLSTFISEDFGVSVAQAQALGWPCLLSHWGAHLDVRGPGVRHVPAALIATGQARELAFVIRSLLAGPRTEVSVSPSQRKVKVRLPAVTRVSKLDSIRRELIGRLGRGAYLISRGEIHPFAATPAGAEFFSDYRKLFSRI